MRRSLLTGSAMWIRMRSPERPDQIAHSHATATALCVTIAGLCVAFPVKAAERYEGDAHAPGNGRLLYRESHWRDRGAGVDTRIALYRCPDGTAFARKRIRVVSNAQAPDFVLVDARNGYSEGVRSKGDAREVFVRANKTAAERVAPIRIQAETVIDAGFDAFVRTHWDALSGTRATPLSFVVPSRLAALDFNVRRIDDETIDGHAVRRFRLALASWYGGLLPHIDILYGVGTRRLRRYEGIGNVRDIDAHNLDVRIEFTAQKRDLPASAADIAAAAAAPLTGVCPLT